MKDFNSLTERQEHFEWALSEAQQVRGETSRAAVQRQNTIGKTAEVGR